MISPIKNLIWDYAGIVSNITIKPEQFPNRWLPYRTFINCRFVGDFSRFNFNYSIFHNVMLLGAEFNYASFNHAQLKNIIFSGMTLYYTRFYSADLTGAQFVASHVELANFACATAVGANFKYAYLGVVKDGKIRFCKNINANTEPKQLESFLKHKFSGTNIDGAMFDGALVYISL